MTLKSGDPGQTSTDQHQRRLLAQVVSGDARAFEQLFYAYHPRVLRFALRMVKRQSMAEEITNDTLLVVWNKAHTFAGNSQLSSWVFGIAYRVALKALRQQKMRRMFVSNDAAIENFSIDNGYGLREDHAWLQQGFDQLSPSQRAVIELSFYNGYGYAEIGSILKCPENTVKTRMYHARKKLKSVLPELAGETANSLRWRR